MATEYGEIVRRLLDLVETTSVRPLSLDDLSERAGLSKYHLHRLFKAATGFPIMEYERRRRLARSLAALADTGLSVIDVAVESGFSFEQSYARAFRRAYGTSPGKWREARVPLEITEAIDPGSLESAGPDAVVVAPRTVLKPAAVVWGRRHRIPLKENEASDLVARAASDFFFRERPSVGRAHYDRRYVGAVIYSGDPEYNWYLAGAELKPGADGHPPAGWESFAFGTRRFAEFVVVSRKHPRAFGWADVEATYRHIFDRWIPANWGGPRAGWHLEYVDADAAREDYGEFRILIPSEVDR